MKKTKLTLFQGQKIRRVWDDKEGKWYFSVVDIVEVLTDSINPRDYWYKMKIRVNNEGGVELSTICRQLKLEANDGKKYLTDVADVEAVFRIIQSVPSPKAEPFKQWLARVDEENVARRGGGVAGVARRQIEKETKRPVISNKNYSDRLRENKTKLLK